MVAAFETWPKDQIKPEEMRMEITLTAEVIFITKTVHKLISWAKRSAVTSALMAEDRETSQATTAKGSLDIIL
jgi:hypothetical protein